jgi:hypothetical protein
LSLPPRSRRRRATNTHALQPPRLGLGRGGTYVYRFETHNSRVGIIDWIADPFAREYDIGKRSAITPN